MTNRYIYLLAIACFLLVNFLHAQNQPPNIEAEGDQVYCPLSQINITTSFNIIDPDDTEIEALHVQISTGYVQGEDVLILTGNHPNINATWSVNEGKMSLTGLGGTQANYTDLIAAVNSIVFENNSATVSGERFFSFTIGDANYLPSTDHYYEYIPSPGITWSAALAQAETLTYFGLQGYLATITSQEEAQLSGEQAAGAGWIGGSDQADEGVWRWMSGPELGTIFWNGGVNGTSPNYANWNNGEPNNLGGEHYAHVTAPGVGVDGSWNDLSNTGDPDPNSDYHPQGFIVEYGGTPGDPVVDISASTKITITSILSTVDGIGCGEASVTLEATAAIGDVLWFDSANGGTPIATGTTFNTPFITTTTTYFALASANGCLEGERIPVIATINPMPPINTLVVFKNCDEDGLADGFTNFNLNEINDAITNNDSSGLDFTYYLTETDAQNEVNMLDASAFSNAVSNIVYARVESANDCFRVATINLEVSTTSFSNGFVEIIEQCDQDDENDGFSSFNLTQVSQSFLNQFPSGQNLSVHYYNTLEDAELEQNEITNASSYINQTPFSEFIYVRVESADNGDCFGIGPHLNLIVRPRPEFDVESAFIYCLETDPIFVETQNADGVYTYEWKDAGGNIISNLSSAYLSSEGNYTVVATSYYGCESLLRTVNVQESDVAVITQEDISVVSFSNNNSITINTTNLGVGDYEFALDNVNGLYQDEPYFNMVSAGIHTIYVRDKNGCGVTSIDVGVLGFPKYFTPNGDTFNETWNVVGWTSANAYSSKIYIFDRFGKLITQFSPASQGWNGTFNGENVSASDYWYVAKLLNSDGTYIELKGHFSLIR